MASQSPTMDLLNKEKAKAGAASGSSGGKAKKAAAKKSTTKKAATKKMTGKGPPDLFVAAAHEIENLKSESAARKMAMSIIDESGIGNYRLGGVLDKIKREGWFGEYERMRDYAEAELGIAYRKLMYCLNVYEKITELEIPWQKAKTVQWSKFREILPVLTEENVDEWLEIARNHSFREVVDLVAKAKGGAKAVDDGKSSSDLTSMSFKVHKDQKENIRLALDKAKEELQTDYDAVALESICVASLGEAGLAANVKVPALADQFKNILTQAGSVMGAVEKIFAEFEKVFPTVTLNVDVPDED